MSFPDGLSLVADPSYRLQLLLGLGAVLLLSLLSVYVAGARLLITGLALAEAASLGAALSLVFPVSPLVLSPVVTALMAGLTPMLRHRRLPADAGLLLLFLASGSGAYLIAASSGSGEADVLQLLNGQLLTAGRSEAIAVVAVALVCTAVWAIGRTPLLLALTQRDFARQQGVPVAKWEGVALLTLGLAVGLTFPAMGVLASVAALTCPGLVALMRSRSLAVMPHWSLGTGVCGYLIGITAAFACDWPPGPAIAGALVLMTIVVAVLSRNRH